MMQSRSTSRKCFRPLAFLYRWAVQLRNFCFDQGWIKGQSYPIPIICVGNVTVGGSGKTPHVELIVRLLCDKYRVAVLTRGYGRKSRGQIVASESATSSEIGDEPRQIKRKYPSLTVLVDGNRCRAMEYLMRLPDGERPEVVVMDDGFQHRYIRPSYSIVLVDATRPVWEEKLLPEGLLREPLTALQRADAVIATKCPNDMPPIGYRLIKRNLNLYPHQRIYFSRIKYQPLVSLVDLLPEGEILTPHVEPRPRSPVVLLSGIANPETFAAHLVREYRLIDKWIYPDHHAFTPADLAQWERLGQGLTRECPDWRIICTEKDAIRLLDIASELPHDLLARIYYLPIAVQILDRERDFKDLIDRLAQGQTSARLFPNRYEQ